MVNTLDMGVPVSDLDRSYEFYTQILGMEKTETWEATGELSKELGINKGKAVNIKKKLDCDGIMIEVGSF